MLTKDVVLANKKKFQTALLTTFNDNAKQLSIFISNIKTIGIELSNWRTLAVLMKHPEIIMELITLEQTGLLHRISNIKITTTINTKEATNEETHCCRQDLNTKTKGDKREQKKILEDLQQIGIDLTLKTIQNALYRRGDHLEILIQYSRFGILKKIISIRNKIKQYETKYTKE